MPLRGGRRGPASLPCVCLSNRLGLAAPAPPVGDEVLRAGMLVDWPGRPGPRDPVELHPTRCSFKASLPAGAPTSSPPNRWTRASHPCCAGPPGPSSQAKPAQSQALLGLFFPGVHNHSSPHTFWDRERGTERTNSSIWRGPTPPGKVSAASSVVRCCGVWRDRGLRTWRVLSQSPPSLPYTFCRELSGMCPYRSSGQAGWQICVCVWVLSPYLGVSELKNPRVSGHVT